MEASPNDKSVEPPPKLRVFTGDNAEVYPDFRSEYQVINPSIDYVNGVPYIGLWIPSKVLIERKKKEKDYGEPEKEVTIAPKLFIISGEREIFLVTRDGLLEKKLFLEYNPEPSRLRWRIQDINAFLEGKEEYSNPAEVNTLLNETVQAYVEFQEPEITELVALYFMATYFIQLPCFDCAPYLYVGGTKRVGKTKLLTLAQTACFNGIFSTSISTSSLFRLVHGLRATMLIDETEALHSAERQPELRAILLGGFMRGSYVYRVEEDASRKRYPCGFNVFSCKVIANIGGLENILTDRCLPIYLLRSLNPAILNSYPDLENPIWDRLRNKLYLLYLLHASEISEVSEVSEVILEEAGVTSRAKLLWTPIVTMALLVEKYGEKGLAARMIDLAGRIEEYRRAVDETENEDVVAVQILADLCKDDDYYFVKDIRAEMVKALGEEKQGKDGSVTYDAPRWLTASHVGNLLRRLGFQESRRAGSKGAAQVRIQPKKVTSLVHRMVVRRVQATLKEENGAAESTSEASVPSVPSVDKGKGGEAV